LRPSISSGIFVDRNVIVTGASSGIGRDVALMFAGEGARVALFARRKHLLLQAANEIHNMGGIALPIVCDVTSPLRVAEAVSEVADVFGGVDILVSSAGVLFPALFSEARLDDLRRMMEVNFFGATNVIHAVLPIMQRAARGNIVNIASIAGRRGGMTLSGYSASKFALIGFTESLRVELFGTGITASLVVPASVDTEMLDNSEWQSRSWAVGNLKMPPEWVTWGVVAAVTLGLAEVEVPPGIVTMEKVASLFPDLTAAWFGAGSKAIEFLNSLLNSNRR
jgi:NAD(P)-dependent dehydrogenase (short-subunit alcohol dehydrogenase family)